jgi:hypothetical protein
MSLNTSTVLTIAYEKARGGVHSFDAIIMNVKHICQTTE